MNTNGKVHGRKIIERPARNAKEYPGINCGEVHKLKRPMRIIEKRMNAADTNEIFRELEFIN
jgi:hypothetical protein